FFQAEDGIRDLIVTGVQTCALPISPTQHFTQPPPRYSEASLVKSLEKEGIGRPSTYAAIIGTIQKRGYVDQKERRFYATELGQRSEERRVGKEGRLGLMTVE